jgi:D-sedoheptulose 7-phosphate isomerase
VIFDEQTSGADHQGDQTRRPRQRRRLETGRNNRFRFRHRKWRKGSFAAVPRRLLIEQSGREDPRVECRVRRYGREQSGYDRDLANQHLDTFHALIRDSRSQIEECAAIILETVKNGKKVLICGNGGSAADAQHIAAEFVGRYETERQALPAIALTTDTSALTALANDYDFERIFSRQVEALASEGDCLIGISTSGNSPNVISAVMTARRKGCKIIGMTGANGKKLAALCDACLMVPSTRTARIQEAHITVAHIWCELVDAAISQSS